MKKIYFYLTFLVLLLCGHLASAQDLSIDVTKLRDTQTVAAKFAQGINIIFQGEKAAKAPGIIILSDQGAEQKPMIEKSGADYILKISYSNTTRMLETVLADGKKLSLSGSQGIGIYYMRKFINIKNDGTGAPPVKSKNANVYNSALQDALTLSDLFKKGDTGIYILLAKLKHTDEKDPNELAKLYHDNAFMKKFFEELNAKRLKETGAGINSGGIAQFGAKALGWDVTSATDGMAKFLAERSKQELSIAFFRRFKELINKPEYRDAQILFPRTMETLNVIDRDIYMFENYISTLRESFKEDLSLLLDRMPKVIKEGRFSVYFTNHPDLKYSALIGLFIAMELTEGTHPADIIRDLPADYIEKINSTDLKSSIKLVQIISESLRSPDEGKYWETKEKLKLLASSEDNFLVARLYLGLLYEQVGEISFGGEKLTDALNKLAPQSEKVQEAIALIKQVGEKCSSIESALAELKEKKDEQPRIELYHRIFLSSTEIIEMLSDNEKLAALGIINPLAVKIPEYMAYAKNAANLALNLNRNNYGSAVVDIFNLYSQYTGQRDKSSNELQTPNGEIYVTKPQTANLDDKKAKEAVKKASEKANEESSKTAAFIKKYGNFMANVVNASGSSDISAAIKAVALPVGSASMKRQNSFSISLNAYVGPYVGSEKIHGLDNSYKLNTAGLTAPIGIAINKSFGFNKKAGWSASLFLSIVDIGAPVAFRFKDNETEQIPTIKLGDIISPGAFISLGIPKVPISFNVGYQTGPLLRKLSDSVAEKSDTRYSRISAAFVLDIPLLNFLKSR
jgi:hypothetical protein